MKELAGAVRQIMSKEMGDLCSQMRRIQNQFNCAIDIEKKIDEAINAPSTDSTLPSADSPASFVAIVKSELKLHCLLADIFRLKGGHLTGGMHCFIFFFFRCR